MQKRGWNGNGEDSEGEKNAANRWGIRNSLTSRRGGYVMLCRGSSSQIRFPPRTDDDAQPLLRPSPSLTLSLRIEDKQVPSQVGLFIIPVVVGLDCRARSPRRTGIGNGCPHRSGRHRRRRRFGRRGSTMQCQSRRGEPVQPTPRMGKYA